MRLRKPWKDQSNQGGQGTRVEVVHKGHVLSKATPWMNTNCQLHAMNFKKSAAQDTELQCGHHAASRSCPDLKAKSSKAAFLNAQCKKCVVHLTQTPKYPQIISFSTCRSTFQVLGAKPKMYV